MRDINSRIKDRKKGQMITEYHLTYKAPLVGIEPNLNNFLRDLKKLQDFAWAKNSTEVE